MNLQFKAASLAALTCLCGCHGGPDLPDFNEVPRNSQPSSVTPDPVEVVEAAADSETAAAAEAVLPSLSADSHVLGRVGRLELTAADLISGLSHRQGDILRGEINRAIGERLARQEAARIGLRLDPQEVDRRSAAHLGQFAREVVPEGVELEDFVRQVMQRDPAAFRAAIGKDTLGEMVIERVVRAFTLGQEHARVRMLVADQPTVDAARQRLDAGEDFIALIGELSRDPSAKDGGLIPFLINAPQSPLANLVFLAPIGEVSGPLDSEDGRTVLVRVEERPEPLVGDWPAVGSGVEESLSETPVSEGEFLFWQIEMENRYQVDLAALSDLLDG